MQTHHILQQAILQKRAETTTRGSPALLADMSYRMPCLSFSPEPKAERAFHLSSVSLPQGRCRTLLKLPLETSHRRSLCQKKSGECEARPHTVATPETQMRKHALAQMYSTFTPAEAVFLAQLVGFGPAICLVHGALVITYSLRIRRPILIASKTDPPGIEALQCANFASAAFCKRFQTS
jgi:hypothetical protein